jgi:hypothetical protein
MTVYFSVRLTDVKFKKNNYWLVFSAYADSMDKNKEYYIEFCGTEIITNISLSDSRMDELRNMLLKDYGYSPYNPAKVIDTLKTHNFYQLP